MKVIISNGTVVSTVLCLLIPLSFVNAEGGDSCSRVVSEEVQHYLDRIDEENKRIQERTLKGEAPTQRPISVLPGVREGTRKAVTKAPGGKVYIALKLDEINGENKLVDLGPLIDGESQTATDDSANEAYVPENNSNGMELLGAKPQLRIPNLTGKKSADIIPLRADKPYEDGGDGRPEGMRSIEEEATIISDDRVVDFDEAIADFESTRNETSNLKHLVFKAGFKFSVNSVEEFEALHSSFPWNPTLHRAVQYHMNADSSHLELGNYVIAPQVDRNAQAFYLSWLELEYSIRKAAQDVRSGNTKHETFLSALFDRLQFMGINRQILQDAVDYLAEAIDEDAADGQSKAVDRFSWQNLAILLYRSAEANDKLLVLILPDGSFLQNSIRSEFINALVPLSEKFPSELLNKPSLQNVATDKPKTGNDEFPGKTKLWDMVAKRIEEKPVKEPVARPLWEERIAKDTVLNPDLSEGETRRVVAEDTSGVLIDLLKDKYSAQERIKEQRRKAFETALNSMLPDGYTLADSFDHGSVVSVADARRYEELQLNPQWDPSLRLAQFTHSPETFSIAGDYILIPRNEELVGHAIYLTWYELNVLIRDAQYTFGESGGSFVGHIAHGLRGLGIQEDIVDEVQESLTAEGYESSAEGVITELAMDMRWFHLAEQIEYACRDERIDLNVLGEDGRPMNQQDIRAMAHALDLFDMDDD